MVNSQVEARRLGIYSTSSSTIYIDNVDQTLQIVPLSSIPLNTPALEKSDAIYSISSYLTRVGTYERPDFNYQQLANQIVAKWACIQYPENYYHNGGNRFGMNVGSMRGEVYAYYIRWIYTTGDKSASYSIPGLPGGIAPTLTTVGGGTLADGGIIVATGRFEGYSSTEIYDDRHPNVWGSLCGMPIMHHKFPDQTHFGGLLTHYTSGLAINIMGVFFENIQLPVDNNGVLIPDIQGYEILRAVRDGHKSVIAKGMVNSMRAYTDPFTGKPGLFQNYPYNDQNSDLFLTTDVNIVNTGSPNTATNRNHNTDSPLINMRQDVVSFHSPDTTFQHPVLGIGNLNIVQQMSGFANGYFQQSYRHGNFKTLTDFSSSIASVIAAVDTIINIFLIVGTAFGGSPPEMTIAATEDIPLTFPLYFDNNYTLDFAATDAGTVAKYAGAIGNAAMFLLLAPIKLKVLQQQILTIINGLVPSRAFAWQYNSAGFYNIPTAITGSSHAVQDYQYMDNHLSEFAGASVNNLYRNKYVALQLSTPIPFIGTVERSRQTMFQRSVGPQDNDSFIGPFNDQITSYYAAYVVPQAAQYGQVDSCKQVPISCVIPASPSLGSFYTSPILFGGDTYITRYTEKNPFFFFNDWLVNAPDDFQYNYRNYINVPYPRYWIDNTRINTNFLSLADRLRHLDAQVNGGTIPFIGVPIDTYVKNGAFYLFCNGVRDFYVESEVNCGYRDWEDITEKRFYDPYGYQDIAEMFRSDLIKAEIYYKYDYSLSAARFWNQYISWGSCLRRDYDPLLAYTCFAYYPRRVAYSLPQDEELRRDNWRQFLPNNYKDFNSKVTAIKEIHKSGALILLKDQAPQQFVGTSVIPSSSGTEFTTGTGSLFNQDLLSVSNADNALQYGSCQNRLSIVNTPHGVFWASQNTGKIFNYTGQTGMTDITPGLKWHLSRYLPSQLLQQFPNYPLFDNPVVGVGVQVIYDNINEVLYICKKDYKLVNNASCVAYDPIVGWYIPGPVVCPQGSYPVMSTAGCPECVDARGIVLHPKSDVKIPITLGDPQYFENCSWTLSYDCKTKQWISFSDWFPELNIPAKTHFLTSKLNQLWRHNAVTNSFCNFYGVQYPFEVAYPIVTGTEVTTLQSIECIVESNLYRTNQTDKFLQFDGFFDRAIIYNKEQNSGWLQLNLVPWNDPYARLAFPSLTAFGTQILYSRIENKWRFQTFYDLTDDRGEFGLANVQAVNTDTNGYTFSLNPLYFNPTKQWDQKKRFRARGNFVFLRKNNPGINSLSLIISKSINQNSPR